MSNPPSPLCPKAQAVTATWKLCGFCQSFFEQEDYIFKFVKKHRTKYGVSIELINHRALHHWIGKVAQQKQLTQRRQRLQHVSASLVSVFCYCIYFFRHGYSACMTRQPLLFSTCAYIQLCRLLAVFACRVYSQQGRPCMTLECKCAFET